MSLVLAFLGNIFTLSSSLMSFKSFKIRIAVLLAIFFTFLINKSLSILSVSYIESYWTFLALLLICFLNITKIKLRFVLPWFFLGVFYLLLAIGTSYALVFTIEKLIFFFILVLAVSTVTPVDGVSRAGAVNIFMNSGLIVLYVSLILWLLPSISYEKTYGRDLLLFQGIANHPQTFGVFVAGIASYFGVKLLVMFSRTYLLHFSSAVAALLMSGARTAMLAFGMVVIIVLFRRKLALLRLQLNKLIRGGLAQVIIVILGVTFLILPTTRSFIKGIVLKRENVESVSDSFQDSRGIQVLRVVKNIKESPWRGIGFALPSDEDSYKENIRYTSFGMPYGVNTEKGFLPLAIIEETGIVGFCAFILVLIYTLVKVDFEKPISAYFFVLLFSNIGEMFFFSPGGLGLLLWITLALSWKTN